MHPAEDWASAASQNNSTNTHTCVYSEMTALHLWPASFHSRRRADASFALFLPLQGWRPTWSLAGKWSLDLTVAALLWAWLDQSMRILSAPLPGCTPLMELRPHATCLQTAPRWKTLEELYKTVTFVSFSFLCFFLTHISAAWGRTQSSVLLLPLWG